MSLTRPDAVLLSGVGLILAAGATATASLMLSSPEMFYVAFPVGVLGVFVAAAGYLMEEALAHAHSRVTPSMGVASGSGQLAARGQGAKPGRDRAPRQGKPSETKMS